ncbi:MAG: ATP-dependent DNA helicase RecG [Patescibacteria group bacterium]
MLINLKTPVSYLNKIAARLAPKLKKLEIETIADLIFYYPFRYDDFSQVVDIRDLAPGVTATVRGRVELIKNFRSWRARRIVTEAIITDITGSVKVIWFGQPFVSKILQPNDEVFIAGKVDFDKGILFHSPSYEKITKVKAASGPTHTARLVPVYPLTKGITSKQIRYLIKIVLTQLKSIKDYLPAEIILALKFPGLIAAIRQIHFPDSQARLQQARRRLKFDEFFIIQLQNQLARRELEKSHSSSLEFKEGVIKNFVASLPFKLTTAQRKAAWEILKDLQKNQPMNRLLEGDVGSGKTVVATLAMLNVVSNKYQAALLCPTEILANQHFQTVSKLLSGADINIGLLTRGSVKLFFGSLGEAENKKHSEVIKMLKAGKIDVIIGTHALIQEKIEFKNLALAIVDEQHRFGVKQRQALKERAGNSGLLPHFLSMTATPIPRSLALTIYGDLDLSIIDELPLGRKKIITKIIESNKYRPAYQFIRQQIEAGRQAFVICPLIDPSDKLGVKSAEEEFIKLDKEIFPEHAIGILHGRLKSAEKERVRQDFLVNKIKVLVATAVVEVGMDVPNATVMMIEGAERFGLAQLHQFRGRVGRSEHQSYCFLFTESASEITARRLAALVASQDGFALAEKDLEFRGPGETLGTMQSGLPNLRLASLFDLAAIKQAREWAAKVIHSDPELSKYYLLKDKVREMAERVHWE